MYTSTSTPSVCAAASGPNSTASCLRTFRNERYHDELSRGAALTTLSTFLRNGGLIPG